MWNEGSYPHMMGGFGFGDGSWWLPMGFHGLFSLLIIGLLIYGIVLAVRSFTNGHTTNPALDALGSRYAAGELNREEYLQKKKDIED
ncbi:SHOCT domain-containing protein [Magnetovibrio sp. PR-2]|uniref:SHOCT domain-containing protein n=1 Tax=Magnetovibrio sp. PR-2 TaxID=3120356 RepID=UPI002FCE0B06